MALCGGWMMAMSVSTSNIPRLLTVKVPPEYSSGLRLPDFARSARLRLASAIWARLLPPQSRIAGAMSPSSSAIATQTLIASWRRISPSTNQLLKIGWRASAIAVALTIRSFTLTRNSCAKTSLSWPRARCASVISISIVM